MPLWFWIALGSIAALAFFLWITIARPRTPAHEVVDMADIDPGLLAAVQARQQRQPQAVQQLMSHPALERQLHAALQTLSAGGAARRAGLDARAAVHDFVRDGKLEALLQPLQALQASAADRVQAARHARERGVLHLLHDLDAAHDAFEQSLQLDDTQSWLRSCLHEIRSMQGAAQHGAIK